VKETQQNNDDDNITATTTTTTATTTTTIYIKINRLQRIQNRTTHILTDTRKYDHITPILPKLYWLPVRQRIHYKVMLITYKSIHDMVPEYLCERVSIRKSSRKLRYVIQ